jgi:hypothetical protein
LRVFRRPATASFAGVPWRRWVSVLSSSFPAFQRFIICHLHSVIGQTLLLLEQLIGLS